MPEGDLFSDGQHQDPKQDAESVDNTDYAERRQAFMDLRLKTLAQVKDDTRTRIGINPHPTEEEIAIGVFIEELEPQVRGAVQTLYRKGYGTRSSGFYGEYDDLQGIEGWFTVDEATKTQLAAIGVEVKQNVPGYNALIFRPEEPNLETMKKQWDKIVALMPDQGKPAPPSGKFRHRFSPNAL